MTKREKEDKAFFNEKDKKTGKRYDIPMLSKTDHDYRENYIQAMRLKKEDPESFARMMDWK